MSDRLRGKAALVTGGGNGIGRGICLAFADEGARIAIIDVDTVAAQETAALIRNRGAEAFTIFADIASPTEIESAVATVVDAFGAIDVLVNAAIAVSGRRPLMETTIADCELMFRTGPLASFLFMQACHPHMKSGDCSVINLGSGSEMLGAAGYSAYAPAKAAIRTLSKVSAREFGPDGIRVNCLVPAAKTRLLESWERQDPEAAEAARMALPLRRFGDPELDIGLAAVFLASSDSRYVTGSTLMVDGGSCLL